MIRRRPFPYLWTLPNTLLGLLIWGLLRPFGPSRARPVDGVLEIHGRAIAHVLRRLPIAGGAAAITFGHVVFGRTEGELELSRRHERVHVRQYERWGPLFLPAYLFASALAALAGRDPYQDNRFEREADAADLPLPKSVEASDDFLGGV